MKPVTIPASIRKIAKQVKELAEQHNLFSLDTLPEATQEQLFKASGCHEKFWSDTDRYLGDLHARRKIENKRDRGYWGYGGQ